MLNKIITREFKLKNKFLTILIFLLFLAPTSHSNATKSQTNSLYATNLINIYLADLSLKNKKIAIYQALNRLKKINTNKYFKIDKQLEQKAKCFATSDDLYERTLLDIDSLNFLTFFVFNHRLKRCNIEVYASFFIVDPTKITAKNYGNIITKYRRSFNIAIKKGKSVGINLKKVNKYLMIGNAVS